MAFAGCQAEKSPANEPVSPETYFPIGFGTATLELQLALNSAERQKGLMFRSELGADQGMLFLFERPERRGFWMKNTSIPLDLGYVDAGGRLVEVHSLYPFDETAVPSRSGQILIAVEMNQGWFKSNGVEPGASLDMEALKDAVAKRGFNIANFALED